MGSKLFGQRLKQRLYIFQLTSPLQWQRAERPLTSTGLAETPTGFYGDNIFGDTAVSAAAPSE